MKDTTKAVAWAFGLLEIVNKTGGAMRYWADHKPRGTPKRKHNGRLNRLVTRARLNPKRMERYAGIVKPHLNGYQKYLRYMAEVHAL